MTTPSTPTMPDRLRDCCRVIELLFYTLFWLNLAWISLYATRSLAAGGDFDLIGQHSFTAAALLSALLAAKNLAYSASLWGIFEQVWQNQDNTLMVRRRPARRPLVASAVGAGASLIFLLASRAPAFDTASALPSGSSGRISIIGLAALLLIFCALHALLYYGLASIEDLPVRSETIEEARNTALVFLVATAWPYLPLAVFALLAFELLLILLPRENSLIGRLISFLAGPACVLLVLAASIGLVQLLPPFGATLTLYGASAGIAFVAFIHAQATIRAAHWTPVYR